MNRQNLIKRYISNFNELRKKVQKNLLKDLKVFSDLILLSLIKKKAHVIVLPMNKKFTDLKEFSHWRGKPFYVKG